MQSAEKHSKAPIINMFKNLKDDVCIMNGQICNFSKEIVTIKKLPNENPKPETKNSLSGLNSRKETSRSHWSWRQNLLNLKKEEKKNEKKWEFPGSPVVRTLCFHCQGPSSIPDQGTMIQQPVRCGQKKRMKKNYQRLRALRGNINTGLCGVIEERKQNRTGNYLTKWWPKSSPN